MGMDSNLIVKKISLERDRIKSFDEYPFNIEVVKKFQELNFESQVTFLVGENGIGKSTFIEAIAVALGLPAEGGTENFRYETKNTVYTVEAGTGEMRWDFDWDSRFVGYDTRNLNFVNEGHVEASIELEIDGDVENPKLELYVENELYQTVTITNHIQQYQTFKYGSRENDFYIKKKLFDGTEESLLSLDYIDFSEDLVIRFPKGKSCTLKMKADNEILSAKLTIYVYYKAI